MSEKMNADDISHVARLEGASAEHDAAGASPGYVAFARKKNDDKDLARQSPVRMELSEEARAFLDDLEKRHSTDKDKE